MVSSVSCAASLERVPIPSDPPRVSKWKIVQAYVRRGRSSATLLETGSVHGQWAKVQAFARSLTGSNYVFLHGCSASIGVLQDLITVLDPTIVFPGSHFSWNTRKSLRAPGIAHDFKNIKEFSETRMGKALGLNPLERPERPGRDHDSREDILSCDAYFNNTDPYESAFHFFTTATSIVGEIVAHSLEEMVFSKVFQEP